MAGVDLFSTLPSSLLMIIISFLPFKEAARTSVLSKQWRDIWRDTLNIKFNETFFVRRDEPEEKQNIQRNAFVEFVRQFIARYSQPVIKSFELTCSRPERFLVDMQNFISFAISRNVKEFVVDFSDPTWKYDEVDDNHHAVFRLPSQFYNLRAILESLMLYSCSFDVSRLASFSVLNTLSLGWIEINLATIRGVLENCPMLECLWLKKCWNIEHIEISMTDLRLKTLVIDRCEFDEEWFLIEGPRLKYFKYSGKVGQFHLDYQPAMVEADLDFGLESSFDEIGIYLYQLLEDLFAVQVLTVCSVLLQIVPSGEEPLGVQSGLNVNHLILKTAMHANEFCGIMFMLRSCPKLETLTIVIGPAIIYRDYEPPFKFNSEQFWSWHPPIQRCVVRTLKVVNVMEFKGTLNELYVLRYIINLGKVMEQLNLYLSDEEGENGENRKVYMGRAQQVMEFISASPNLRIRVFERVG